VRLVNIKGYSQHKIKIGVRDKGKEGCVEIKIGGAQRLNMGARGGDRSNTQKGENNVTRVKPNSKITLII